MNQKRKISTTRNTINHNNSSSSSSSIPTTQTSMFSTIKETITTGFGLGIGNEIAHRVVSSVLGPRTISVTQNAQNTQFSEYRCKEELEKYEKCLKQNNCLDEIETYQTCVKKYS